jgi:hypothetical protein
MSTKITFTQIQSYLDTVAGKGTLDITGSPHKVFWKVSYAIFITAAIPHTRCKGNPIPIINTQDPANSPFYIILTSGQGFCNFPQMPVGGPYITDSGYSITLANGTVVTGAQIQKDILDWLTNGYPEGI